MDGSILVGNFCSRFGEAIEEASDSEVWISEEIAVEMITWIVMLCEVARGGSGVGSFEGAESFEGLEFWLWTESDG